MTDFKTITHIRLASSEAKGGVLKVYYTGHGETSGHKYNSGGLLYTFHRVPGGGAAVMDREKPVAVLPEGTSVWAFLQEMYPDAMITQD